MSRRRVVITGLGAVTPTGNNVQEFWQGICAGKVGIGSITRFDAQGYMVKIAAEVQGFEPKTYKEPKPVRNSASVEKGLQAYVVVLWGINMYLSMSSPQLV